MVSKGALGLVRWRADSKELLYLGRDGGLMAAALTGGSVFQPSPPQMLFKLPPEFLRLPVYPGVLADVSRDNQKILLSIPAQESVVPSRLPRMDPYENGGGLLWQPRLSYALDMARP